MSELSPKMLAAVEFAQRHGGSLARFPGGFWRQADADPWDVRGSSFGSSTVHALVTRGVADYTEWKDGRNGRFPVRMTLRPSPTPANQGEQK